MYPVGTSALREASSALATSSRIARADWLPVLSVLLLALGVSSTAALAGTGGGTGAGMVTGATEREPELPGMRGS